MKKRLLTALLGLFTIALWAQEESDTPKSIDERVHELRLDALEGLIIPAIDVSYEYVISRFSGVGITANVAFESGDDEEFDQDWAISPFYRQYFFNKKDYGARGLYAEGLLQVAGGNDFDSFIIGNGSQESWTKFGIGFGLGQKWG